MVGGGIFHYHHYLFIFLIAGTTDRAIAFTPFATFCQKLLNLIRGSAYQGQLLFQTDEVLFKISIAFMRSEEFCYKDLSISVYSQFSKCFFSHLSFMVSPQIFTHDFLISILIK